MIRVFPLVLPNGQWLDQDPGFQQDLVGDVGQRELGVEKCAAPPVQQDGDIRVAVGAMIAPRPAAEENGSVELIGIRHALNEQPHGAVGFRLDYG